MPKSEAGLDQVIIDSDQGSVVDPEVEERRHQRTLLALADVTADRLVDDESIQAWADRVEAEFERRAPRTS